MPQHISIKPFQNVYMQHAVIIAGLKQLRQNCTAVEARIYYCITLSWSQLPENIMCKMGHFSLLHHFRHRTKHRSRHFNHANHAYPFPAISTSNIPNISTSGFSKSTQNTHTHLILFYFTVIDQYMSKHLFFTV